MMKKFKSILFIVAAIFMSVPAFADGEWDIKVFRPGVNPRDHMNDVMVRAGDKYTAETGGKVTYILGESDGVESRVLSNIAANDPIDVVYVTDDDFPRYKLKGLLQPFDEYIDVRKFSYQGVQIFNYVAEESVFKQDYSYYAVSQYNSNHFWVVTYNKSLMDQAGIPVSEQPLALYQAGQWDWAHMASLAQRLNAANGASFKAVTCGKLRLFAYMNNCNLAPSNGRGGFTNNFNDGKLEQVLQFLETAVTQGWLDADGSALDEKLSQRATGMVFCHEGDNPSLLRSTGDQLVTVPAPYGPSGSPSNVIYDCDGFGIGAGSKKQAAAAKYIEFCLREWFIEESKNRGQWTNEIKNLTNDVKKSMTFAGPSTSVVNGVLDEMLSEVAIRKKSATGLIERYSNKINAVISTAATPVGNITKLPFSNININFENFTAQDLNSYFTRWHDTSSVRYSIVSGPQAVGGTGKSLKIEFDPSVDGTSAIVLITNPEKLGIVGWRNYTVEFDVKLSGGVIEGVPQVYIQAYANELNQYGLVLTEIKNGINVFHAVGRISNVNQNGKIGLIIGLEGCSSVIIDNIKIIEK